MTEKISRLKTEIKYFLDQRYRNFILNKWKYYNILFKLFRKHKDIKIKIDGVELVVPNQSQSFRAIEEVFIEKAYSKLNNLNCVLDLGAFLGESPLYLIKNKNKKVVAVEADPDKFRYLLKNVRRYPNIIPYNKAVSTKKGKLTFTKNYYLDLGANSNQLFDRHKITFEVETITILKLIEKYTPDGIKMDIEGAEFEIIQWFLNNREYFRFKKGYIEFHFEGNKKDNINIFEDFIHLLESNQYYYEIENKLSFDEIIKKCNSLKNKDRFIFHLFFEKIS